MVIKWSMIPSAMIYWVHSFFPDMIHLTFEHFHDFLYQWITNFEVSMDEILVNTKIMIPSIN